MFSSKAGLWGALLALALPAGVSAAHASSSSGARYGRIVRAFVWGTTSSTSRGSGGTIAFQTNRVDPDLDSIFLINGRGTRQTNITPMLEGTGDAQCCVWAWYPTWAPDGTKIAFVGDQYLRVMRADGTGQRRLIRRGRPLWPAWSPTGERIAFADLGDIFVVNAANGRGRTNLTRSPGRDSQPSWSPDGSRIAFVSDRDGNQEIYVMSSDGSGQTNLTRNDATDTDPAWSPDGKKIAFATSRPDAEVYVMSTDGSQQTNLTRTPDADITPAWSPDGTKIAFTTYRSASGRYPDNSEIYVMNADGSAQANLTHNRAADSNPAWHSRSLPPTPCVVPRVIGRPFEIARFRIRRAHCSVGRIRYADSPRAHAVVLRQAPRSGVRLARGSSVNLIVSRGRG